MSSTHHHSWDSARDRGPCWRNGEHRDPVGVVSQCWRGHACCTSTADVTCSQTLAGAVSSASAVPQWPRNHASTLVNTFFFTTPRATSEAHQRPQAGDTEQVPTNPPPGHSSRCELALNNVAHEAMVSSDHHKHARTDLGEQAGRAHHNLRITTSRSSSAASVCELLPVCCEAIVWVVPNSTLVPGVFGGDCPVKALHPSLQLLLAAKLRALLRLAACSDSTPRMTCRQRTK